MLESLNRGEIDRIYNVQGEETRNEAKFHLESLIQLPSHVHLVFYSFLPTTPCHPNL